MSVLEILFLIAIAPAAIFVVVGVVGLILITTILALSRW